MFTFQQRPGKAVVIWDGDPVLTFTQEHVLFRHFIVSDARMRPHGPIEIISLFSSAFYWNKLLRARVDCRQEDQHEIRITVTPEKVEDDLTRYVAEAREFRIAYLPAQDRFRHTITAEIEILRDIRGGEGLYLSPNLQWGGDDYAVLEFDDPLLSGGVGPQVPMTQDWTGLYEPWLAEDCYTTTWKKRYLSVTMHTAERGPQRLVFNRVVNGVQQFYNRHVLKTLPGTPYLYQKTDGAYLRFTPRFPYPCGQHICEWGYDMHWYALLPKASPDCLFSRGQQIRLAYEIEEVTEAEAPDEYLGAPAAAIEPEERVLADRPIYEEPVCEFTRSALDWPDAYDWAPEGACEWSRTGGKAPGHGALEIHHGDQPRESSWVFKHLGPSYACNPIPPSSRFRISAWLKADEPDKVRLTHTVNSYDGPAMYSPITPTVSVGAAQDIQRREGDFACLEFVTQPTGSYNITAAFRFSYAGKGSASLSELKIERI